MADRTDITTVPFSLTLRTVVIAASTLVALTSSSVYALYQLNAKIDDAIDTSARALANTRAMECDVSDIRNFMIYKVRPDGECRRAVRAAPPL